MGGEDDERSLGHVLLGLDEDRAARLQVLDDVDVVDDLVPDVDGRAVPLEQLLDDVDRADDAGAEAPWAGDQDALAHGRAPDDRATAATRSEASARRAPARS